MSPPGPPPMPNNVKRLRGHKPSRMNANEVEVGSGAPIPPPWLSDAARVEFDRLAVECAGVLTPVDGTALALLATDLVEIVMWAEIVAREPIVVEEGRGRRNPGAIALSAARTHAAGLAVQLGMTPASRTRLATSAPPPSPTSWLLDGERLFTSESPRRVQDSGAPARPRGQHRGR